MKLRDVTLISVRIPTLLTMSSGDQLLSKEIKLSVKRSSNSHYYRDKLDKVIKHKYSDRIELIYPTCQSVKEELLLSVKDEFSSIISKEKESMLEKVISIKNSLESDLAIVSV